MTQSEINVETEYINLYKSFKTAEKLKQRTGALSAWRIAKQLLERHIAKMVLAGYTEDQLEKLLKRDEE